MRWKMKHTNNLARWQNLYVIFESLLIARPMKKKQQQPFIIYWSQMTPFFRVYRLQFVLFLNSFISCKFLNLNPTRPNQSVRMKPFVFALCNFAEGNYDRSFIFCGTRTNYRERNWTHFCSCPFFCFVFKKNYRCEIFWWFLP